MGITFLKYRLQRGFTLLEILIFLAILGVLASIAVPQYQDFLARKQISESFDVIEKLSANFSKDHALNSLSCPITPPAAESHTAEDEAPSAVANTAPESAEHPLYLDKVVIVGQFDADKKQGCSAIATFKKEGTAVPLAGKKLQFNASVSQQGVVFTCLKNGATTIAERLLPNTCILADNLQ